MSDQTSKTTRKAQEVQRRQAVLKAARKIFLREGYERARVADIAAEAGVAVGTPYSYFGSKEGMAGALAEEFLDRIFEGIGPELFDVDRPLDVARMVRRALKIAEDDADRFRLGLGQLPGRPASSAVEEARKRLARTLEKRMERGQVRRYEAHALADMLITLIRRAILANSVPEQDIVCSGASYEATLVEVLEHVLDPQKA